MTRKMIAGWMLALCACGASADSWESDQNINRAMDAAVKTYKGKGAAGMEHESKNCYAGLDTRFTNRNLGLDVEYCIANTFSAAIIDNKKVKAERRQGNDYLNGPDVFLGAMHALEQARMVRLPEDFRAYIAPRAQKIEKEMPSRM